MYVCVYMGVRSRKWKLVIMLNLKNKRKKTKPSETPVVPMSKVQDVFVSFVLYG